MGSSTCPHNHGIKAMDEVTGKCRTCGDLNHAYGAGRSKKKGHAVHAPSSYPTYPGLTLDGRILDLEDFKRWSDELEKDEVRYGELLVEARRPGGVSRHRHSIAVRSSLREPMLSANDPFAYVRLPHKLPPNAKMKVTKRFTVKPNDGRAAKGNWFTREWALWSLKYASGFVIVDDKGNESNKYASWHLAKQAIEASGFIIIP